MPFTINNETGKLQFSFTNLLAFTVIMICGTYFFWISFVLTKNQVSDNPTLQQITIVMVTMATLVLNFYFGNSNNSARQQQQISEMQKTATTVALKTADATIAAATGVVVPTENKIDKAVKIEQLKAELAKYPPDTDEAKKLLAELEQLEKI
ncbi:MAG: hypothetical protein V4547_16840 [Bacteroidota bacterium]